ncbi:MAG: response regulator [Cellvibrionaceae bacterium]
MMNILIIEDEKELAKILKSYLENESYRVDIEVDGLHATEKIINNDYDLVLLDLMLPNKDGLTICNEVRKSSSIPIIMMTAKVEEVDRLIGLKLGADDYVCKPYSPREVVARVEAVLRRSKKEIKNNHPSSTDNDRPDSSLSINEDNLHATYQNNSVALTLVEFNILKTLLSRPNKIFSRNELMDSAYSDHRVVNDRTIDSHITKLRKKIMGITQEETIRSVYGAGYKYEEM